MEAVPEQIRHLVTVGLALLLVMLRLDAERFGAAEYDEVGPDGRAPSVRRRLAWYLVGIGLVVAITYVHPRPGSELSLRTGDRMGALTGGFIFAVAGAAQAIGFAWLRYRYLRLPSVGSYPGALTNSIATAFIDEATFRGIVLGLTLAVGIDPGLAIIMQAILYALATRLGAPGRNRYMLLLALVVGLIGGWLTVVTGGIAAAFLAHAVTRFSVFLTTGHAGQVAPRGRETEEIERRRRPPDGWRIIGSR